MIGRAGAIAFALLLGSLAQSRPPDDDYLATLRDYRSGNAEAAVRRLAALDRERAQTGFTAFKGRVLEDDQSQNPASARKRPA